MSIVGWVDVDCCVVCDADALDKAVRDAQQDPEIRAIILTGTGRAFTTGFDLISDDFEMDTEAWRADMTANCERLRVIWNSEVPVVAAINGFALAGGLELAMCCDLAIASEPGLIVCTYLVLLVVRR